MHATLQPCMHAAHLFVLLTTTHWPLCVHGSYWDVVVVLQAVAVTAAAVAGLTLVAGASVPRLGRGAGCRRCMQPGLERAVLLLLLPPPVLLLGCSAAWRPGLLPSIR